MTGLPDPLTRRPFAGTEAELEKSSTWVRAVDELQRKTTGALRPTTESSDDGDGSEKATGGTNRGAAAVRKKKKEEARKKSDAARAAGEGQS